MHHNNVFVLYILRFFLTDQQRLEANNCENTSFNQQMIVVHRLNLSMYEMKLFSRGLKFLQISLCLLI